MSSSAKNSKRARLRIALPATSANLGPAFDAAALAMDFYIKLDARAANEFSIKATGRDQAICGNLQEHLILNTYREVLQAAGRKITPLAIRIDNDIPDRQRLWILCGCAIGGHCDGCTFRPPPLERLRKSWVKLRAASTILTTPLHAGWEA